MQPSPGASLRPFFTFAHCLCALFLLVLAAPMCAAATYYVAPSGNDGDTGGQSDPFLTIQEGITSSSSGDTVIVAAGTYTGQKNVNIDLQGRNITLTSQNGAATTVIDCGGSSSAVHRGFYLHSGEGAHGTTVIRGFTVKNGYWDGTNSQGGGGIYIASGDTITVQNCNFTNCISTSSGGGLDNEGVLTLTNCTFSSDTANGGGAVYNNGTLTVTNCTFGGGSVGNSANGDGSGGSIYNNGTNTLLLTNCSLTNNTAGYLGGAIYNASGNVTITNCSMTSNNANAGGAIYSSSGTLTLTGTTLAMNQAKDNDGGGIDEQNTDINLMNCVVTGNTAANSNGGGLSLYGSQIVSLTNCLVIGNSAGNYGGGVFNTGPTLTLNYVTLSLNAANGSGTAGGGLYVNNGSTAALTDDILYNDTGGEAVDATDGQAAITASYCDILGGYAGTGIFDKNPKFVNPAAGDFHLQTISPCISKGTPITGITTDLDGKPRANPPSIGAYEFNKPPVPSHTQILWDNTNGMVALYNIGSDGSLATPVYGPYAGWKAIAVSDGPDGTTHLLWVNTNGAVSVWNVTAGGFTSHTFGPFTNYKAVSLSTSGDGVTHLLWNRSDGLASLWAVNTTDGTYTHGEIGPFPGWTATAVASGATVTDLLWTNTSGQIAGYRYAANGALTTQVFGPFTSWGAVALSVGPDDEAHPLWDNQNGQVSLWSVDFAGSNILSIVYGPYSGWSAKAVATGPDKVTHLLWNHAPDGQVSLWSIMSGAATAVEYGPYSGWSAVAVSAGP